MSSDLLAKLPLPLARIYLRALNAKSPADRHMNAYYLLEAYIKTAAAVWAQAYLKEPAEDPGVDAALGTLSMPSTGQWVGLLRALVSFFSKLETPPEHPLRARSLALSGRSQEWLKCATLSRAISEKDGIQLGFGSKMSPCDLLDILPAYRNKNLGHGAVALESVQERFGNLLVEAAEELFDRADPMAGNDMVFVEEKRDLGGGTCRIDRLKMMGGMPMRMPPVSGPADIVAGWEVGGLYAVGPEMSIMRLDPLLHATYDDEHAEVYYLNKNLRGGAIEYLSYSTGKVAKVQGIEGELKRFLDGAGRGKGKRAAAQEEGTAGVAGQPSGVVIPFAKERRRSVAVLGFKNSSAMPDSAWISTALAEMLTTELAVGEEFRMIPGESVARMKIELSLLEADTYSMETLSRIRTNIGCDLVILGSYLALGERAGGQIRLDLRIQDTAAGATASSLSETGTVSDFFDFVARSGKKLRQKLGIGELSDVQASQVRAALPATTEAVRLYAEGLAKLRYFDALGAKVLFEQAVAADPDYPLAHSALSAAWSSLGYDGNAKSEAKLAHDLSEGLSREEKLLVEGQYREAALEWDKVTEIYQTLFQFSPDNLDYGLRLAHALSSSGRAKEALAVVEALRKLPHPVCDDPRIDLVCSIIHKGVKDFEKSREAASASAIKANEKGANIIVAKARYLESFALGYLGLSKDALAAAEEGKELSEAAGDWATVAEGQNSAGLILWRQGDLVRAQRKFEGALGTFRKIGKKRGEASALHNLAMAIYKRGDIGESLRFSEQALAAWREIGDKSGVADALNNAGFLCFEMGDTAKAKAMYEEALSIRIEIGDRWGQGYILTNLSLISNEQGDYQASINMCESARSIFSALDVKSSLAFCTVNLGLEFFNAGDLARAKDILNEALELFTSLGELSGKAYALNIGGNVSLERGEVDEARRLLESADEIRKGLGEKKTAGEGLCDIARLSIAVGDYHAAINAATEAAAELEKLAAVEEEADARCLLAQALSLSGRSDEAGPHINRARELLKKADHPHFRLAVATAEANLALLADEPELRIKSLKDLDAAITAAGPAAPARIRYQAKLAAGRLEIAIGQAAEGRARLDELHLEAAEKGFTFVASIASAELGR